MLWKCNKRYKIQKFSYQGEGHTPFRGTPSQKTSSHAYFVFFAIFLFTKKTPNTCHKSALKLHLRLKILKFPAQRKWTPLPLKSNHLQTLSLLQFPCYLLIHKKTSNTWQKILLISSLKMHLRSKIKTFSYPGREHPFP